MKRLYVIPSLVLSVLSACSTEMYGLNEQTVGGAETASPASSVIGPFTKVSLGTLGVYSDARHVNDRGHVAGYNIFPPDYVPRAFFWSPETGMVDIGTLPGATNSNAVGMNNAGQVVGLTEDYSDPSNPVFRAFSWTLAGGIVELPTLGGSSIAHAVNDAGQIVGQSAVPGEGSHAVMWTPAGDIIDLGGNNSYATAVNATGQVIGESPYGRGFFWTESDGMIDIGSFGGGFTLAIALNDSGQVVGQSVTMNGEWHAFSWTQSGGMVDLGTFGGFYSEALSVNGSGQVVGSSSLPLDEDRHAFIWTQETGMVDLGAGSYLAIDINTAGQVVGQSSDYGVFFWTKDVGIVNLGPGQVGFGSINNAGQIVGNGGDGEGVIWNPLPYDFDGFSQPVESGGVFNVAKAGQTIPVRFDLNGDRGLMIFAAGYPKSVAIECQSGATQSVVEGTLSDDASSLLCGMSGEYTYLWKTDKAWTGDCRQLQLKLNDGQLHTANFRFTH